MKSDSKGKLPRSTTKGRGPGSLRGNILNVMALPLLMASLGGCGTFADVAAAQRPIARLEPYKPPRPVPVIPAMVNLAMPEVWNEHDPALPLLCVPIEQGFDLKAWVLAIAKNQAEWAAYADYWESR